MAFLSNLRRRWDDWCGDREMEQRIRRHLSEHGYYGNTATLRRVRLSAVARPGWVQVYQFSANARVRPPETDAADPPPVYAELYGVIRDDARGGQTKLRVFQSEPERRELFDRWSEGLIRTRAARTAS